MANSLSKQKNGMILLGNMLTESIDLFIVILFLQKISWYFRLHLWGLVFLEFLRSTLNPS